MALRECCHQWKLKVTLTPVVRKARKYPVVKRRAFSEL